MHESAPADTLEPTADEVPLVLCESRGGPYPDDAFCAGFTSGLLYATFTTCTANGVLPPAPQWLDAGLVPQADAIAAQFGCRTLILGSDEDGAVRVAFSLADPEPPQPPAGEPVT